MQSLHIGPDPESQLKKALEINPYSGPWCFREVCEGISSVKQCFQMSKYRLIPLNWRFRLKETCPEVRLKHVYVTTKQYQIERIQQITNKKKKIIVFLKRQVAM